MWKIDGDDIKATLLAGAMMIIAIEVVVWAITGNGVFIRG